jgi:hypothetical protein
MSQSLFRGCHKIYCSARDTGRNGVNTPSLRRLFSPVLLTAKETPDLVTNLSLFRNCEGFEYGPKT